MGEDFYMEMSFGKYKGKAAEEVFLSNSGYFNWMKENGLVRKEEYEYYIGVLPQFYPESFIWEVVIRSGYKCWSCKREMDIFLMFNPEVDNELRAGYPIISDLAYNKPATIVPFAKRYGLNLQERFSKTSKEKHIMHICPNCNMHQGDYHVVEDYQQESVLRQTLKIKYDKSNKFWCEI
jgi:hypothetical protein